MLLSTPSLYKYIKNRKRKYYLLLYLLSGFIIIAFLYLTGGLSFLRRSTELSLCLLSADNLCNRLILPKGKTRLLDQDLAISTSSLEIFSQRVIHVGFNKDNLLVWSLNGIMARFFITDDTTYGVAVLINREEIKRGVYAKLLSEEILKPVDNHHFFEGGGLLLIENPPGVMNREEFVQLVGSGNLLKIVYNENNKELIGILLLDFKKI